MENRNWREGKSSELIDLISGFAFKSANFLSENRENTLPIIKIKNVANGDVNLNDVVYHEYNDKLSNYVIEKGDVLIAMTGNHIHAQTQIVGDVSLCKLDDPVLLNQRVGKFVAKNDADLKFAYYLFKDEETRFNLANKASGSANQANVSKTDILDLDILIPPLPEQKAIASVLSSLDDKIDLLHQQNQTLEALAETLFRQWFIEEAKEDWPIYKFKDIVKHVKPGTNFQPKRVNNGIPFLNVKNLNNGFIDLQNNTFITQEEYERVHKNWKPEVGDLLISRIGTLGLVATILERDLPIAVHYNMINLKPKLIGTEFLYFFLKSNHFQEEYFSRARQSVQEYLAIEDVEEIAVKLPLEFESFTIKEQQFIEFYNKIKNNFIQIQTLTQLRDTLLPKLMSGE